MEYLSIILTVAAVHLLAVMSPGPDFVMVARNSLAYSRKAGVYTALGLACGILVHITYSLIGIGLIIAQSIILFTIIKFLGAAYLIYLGYKSFTSKKSTIDIDTTEQKKDISARKAIKIGFLTNVLNPKVTLFFLSLFTLMVTPKTPLGIKVIMGIEMSVATFLWFGFVTYLISHHLIKSRFAKIQHFAEKCIGVVLIALGIKVALSTSK